MSSEIGGDSLARSPRAAAGEARAADDQLRPEAARPGLTPRAGRAEVPGATTDHVTAADR